MLSASGALSFSCPRTRDHVRSQNRCREKVFVISPMRQNRCHENFFAASVLPAATLGFQRIKRTRSGEVDVLVSKMSYVLSFGFVLYTPRCPMSCKYNDFSMERW